MAQEYHSTAAALGGIWMLTVFGFAGFYQARGEWSLVTMAWNPKRMFVRIP
jgi:trehalose/maltose hydrolase-like predicted phosphorylase